MEQRLHKSLRLAATLLFALCASSVWGEKAPIDLTFSAEGESSNVQSVVVSNLTHPDIGAVALSGTSILRLVDAEDYQTLIESVEEAKVISEPIITPNPAVGDGTLIFDAKSDGPVRVSVYTTGGMLLDAATLNVSKGRNTARIPAQGTGIFIVNIDGQGVKSSTRWICGGSKSFGGIALGGAQQWANATLPTRNVSRAPSQNRADAVANVVVMEFNEGDVLRFEGTSGKMTTIVVNAPQRSHSVPFFFYPCVDASGNNYPIIEAGGLLWMAEDLRAMKRLDGVSIFYKDEDTDWASAVQNQESASMAMVVNDNDIYYTYSAARIALPEGWELPTLGELDAVAKNLGGYEVVGDKMKRSGDSESFREKRTALPDSLQLRITPKGYVGEDGKITDSNSGYLLTSTREEHKALFMKITNGSKAGNIPQNGLSNYAAVHIRGVRPAPSSYTDMIGKLAKAQASVRQHRVNAAVDENPFTGEVNPYTGTPYGDYYTVDCSEKYVYADHKGQCYTYDEGFVKANIGITTLYFFANNNNVTEGLEWRYDANGKAKNITRLKKMCAQQLADGTFHSLRVTFDVDVRDPEVDNSCKDKKFQFLARDIEKREGKLYLEEFDHPTKKFKLLRTVTLPGTYSMVELYGNGINFDNVGLAFTNYTNYEASLHEFYMKRLNLLAADFNEDGVDDIVVGFCNKWMVLDGKDYATVLAQRTFPTDCVRACVGDLDENGHTDLGFIYQLKDQIQVRVLMNDVNKLDDTKNPSIDAVADYMASLPTAKAGITSFLDIKFGDITNTGNSILCLAVPFSPDLKSTFYVMDRGAGSLLTQSYKLDEAVNGGGRVVQNGIVGSTYNYPNSTIAVVRTRGLGERADVLLHNGLYRLNDGNQFEPVKIEGEANNQIIDSAIPSDCVAVGHFDIGADDPYEQLMYFGQYISEGTSNMNGWSTAETWGDCYLLTPDKESGTMKRTRKSLRHLYRSGWYIKNLSTLKKAIFPACFPAFYAIPYNNIDIRRYKFESCQATMSEPRIKFALAAAPYWANVPEGYANAGKPYDYGDNAPSTEWAKWTSTESGYENSNSTSASLIFGFEYEAKAEVFGVEVMKYGFEFETNLTHEWEKTSGHTDTWTYESGCAANRDNKVGLTMTPVWLYTYRCVNSNDPDNIGTTLMCGAPSHPRDLELSEADYMILRGDRDDIPDLSKVFTNTPGDPRTYMNNPNQVKSTSGILWSNNNKDKYVSTGSDGIQSLSIEVSDQTIDNTKNTFGFDMKLVGFAGTLGYTAKVGFGTGYSHTWNTIYNTSKGTKVSGNVPLPKRYGDVPSFDWNMCRYTVNVCGQEFPVVNYIVKR